MFVFFATISTLAADVILGQDFRSLGSRFFHFFRYKDFFINGIKKILNNLLLNSNCLKLIYF